MIDAFRLWFSQNQFLLARDGLTFELSAGSMGLPKNGISAVLKSERVEVTIELWETGESEFYLLDWNTIDRDPEAGVVVMHYDFAEPAALYAALDQLVNRMSPVLA